MLDELRWGLGLARLPMILQTEAAECGLACLAMVAAQHGHRIDLPTLRQRFSVSLKGMAEMIEAVTPEQSVLSSDGGQPFNPRPHESLRVGLQSLHEVGISESAIRTMSITNPRKLLGIDT